MDKDIFEVKLVPTWSRSSVLNALQTALGKSYLLQAGVAYWTVTDTLLGPALVRALKTQGGFLCVDLHPPTEIDALAALVRKGAQVYLYCEDIPTTTDFGRKEPPYLLHTKVLFFWSNDRTVELWVGSHNWTNRALAGLNIEASIIIRASDTSKVCTDTAEYLENIRKYSQEFDLSKVDFYKQAQRNMMQRTTPVIELEGIGADQLANITFGLFGTDADDLNALGTVRREVYVSVFDSNTEEQYLYPATIIHSGLLAAANRAAGGISFAPRRHAFRRGRRFPVLQPEGEVGRDILGRAEYFVTLNLKQLDRSQVAEVPPPRTTTWADVSPAQSPILARLDANASSLLFRGRPPQPRRPRVEEEPFETTGSNREPPRRITTLLDRRQLAELPLVSRRILRPRR